MICQWFSLANVSTIEHMIFLIYRPCVHYYSTPLKKHFKQLLNAGSNNLKLHLWHYSLLYLSMLIMRLEVTQIFGHRFRQLLWPTNSLRTIFRVSPTQFISSLPEPPGQWFRKLQLIQFYIFAIYLEITNTHLWEITAIAFPYNWAMALWLSSGRWNVMCWRYKPPPGLTM